MNTNSIATKSTLLLVSSLTVMSGATIAPALPSMQHHFTGVEHADLWVQLVLTLPALLIVLTAPIAGLLADRWGRLRLLIPVLILYGLAGSSGLYLDSIGAILAGRALLGVAVAGVMTGATTLVADYYEGPARSQFMGWQGAFMSFGGVVFLTAGGGLAEIGWRWPFTIYLFSILLLPLALYSLTEPKKVTAGEDMKNGGTPSAGHSKRLLGFIYGVAFFGMILFYFIPLQIPFYLESMLNVGPTASGMAIAVATLFSMATALTYKRISARLGYLSVLGLNFGLMGAGYLLIGLADTYMSVVFGLAVCGLGMGLLFPNLNVWLTSEVPVSLRGRSVGGLTTAVFLGQFLSPLAAQPVSQAFTFGTLFLASGAILLVLAVVFVAGRQLILNFTQPAMRPEHVREV